MKTPREYLAKAVGVALMSPGCPHTGARPVCSGCAEAAALSALRAALDDMDAERVTWFEREADLVKAKPEAPLRPVSEQAKKNRERADRRRRRQEAVAAFDAEAPRCARCRQVIVPAGPARPRLVGPDAAHPPENHLWCHGCPGGADFLTDDNALVRRAHDAWQHYLAHDQELRVRAPRLAAEHAPAPEER